MTSEDPRFYCPVCGYALWFEPWSGDSASDEICPSCGIQFGYDDFLDDAGLVETKEEIYDRWRRNWIAGGMKWWGGNAPPDGWNPQGQLQRIGIHVDSLDVD